MAQAGVSSRREELQVGVDLQRHYERLVLGLEELVTLGSQRLSLLPGAELHTRDRLEGLLSSHTVGGVGSNLWVRAPLGVTLFAYGVAQGRLKDLSATHIMIRNLKGLKGPVRYGV